VHCAVTAARGGAAVGMAVAIGRSVLALYKLSLWLVADKVRHATSQVSFEASSGRMFVQDSRQVEMPDCDWGRYPRW
jgi:hypothetical protein